MIVTVLQVLHTEVYHCALPSQLLVHPGAALYEQQHSQTSPCEQPELSVHPVPMLACSGISELFFHAVRVHGKVIETNQSRKDKHVEKISYRIKFLSIWSILPLLETCRECIL